MIQPQYLNLVNSSFLLWLDNYILEKGEGYTSTNSQFYSISQTYNNLFTYASPYQPIVADADITDPPTGIYVNGVFYNRGDGGFVDFNYAKGQAYFSTKPAGIVSGDFAVKDINILPLDISEDRLLFETKFDLRSKVNQTLSGLKSDAYTYPAAYVKCEYGRNEPFSFGGMDLSQTYVGVFLFCDSQYQLDAIKSILQDSAHTYVPLLTIDKFPYNIYGGLKETGSNFNYDTTVNNVVSAGSGVYIKDVQVTTFDREFVRDFSQLNPDVYWAVVDFKLDRPRSPRASNNL
jgi:hypothetical protein